MNKQIIYPLRSYNSLFFNNYFCPCRIMLYRSQAARADEDNEKQLNSANNAL
jgi:hypothetical protein